MPIFPSSGSSGVQKPVNLDSQPDVQKKQDVTGKHGHRKVEATTPEKKLLVKPRSSPLKKLSEYRSVKKVEPEKTQKPETKSDLKTTPATADTPKPPSEDKQQVMQLLKQSKSWQSLEARLVKQDGKIDEGALNQFIVEMPEMDFRNSRTVSLLSLYAMEQFSSGKLTEEQMSYFMDVYMTCYVKAKADEQVQHAVKMLPADSKKVKKMASPGRTAILAEIAAMTKEKSGNKEALQTARSALKTDMRADLYDTENKFLKKLNEKLEGRIGEIDEHVAEGMRGAIKQVLVAESGSKKLNLSNKRQQKLVAGVDLMVKQFVESQLQEKKQKINNRLGAGEPIQPIIEQIMAKAKVRRAGLIAELTKTAGADLQKTFSKHQIPDAHNPEAIVKRWLEANGKAKELAETPAPTRSQLHTPVHELDAWVDELVKLAPREQQSQIDGSVKNQLRHELDIIAEALDIKNGLLVSPREPSPLDRNDSLRKAIRRKGLNPFKPARRTVTESLGAAINKELAKRAAQRADAELQKSRVRPEPKREKATAGPESRKHKELEGDGLVPTLVRQFEHIIRNEKERVDGNNQPAKEGRRPRR